MTVASVVDTVLDTSSLTFILAMCQIQTRPCEVGARSHIGLHRHIDNRMSQNQMGYNWSIMTLANTGCSLSIYLFDYYAVRIMVASITTY